MIARICIIQLCLFSVPIISLAQTNSFPNSGNVGIGTTTPTKKLDVVGATRSEQFSFPLVNYDFSAAPRTQLDNMSIKLFDDYHTRRPGGSTPDNNRYGTLLAIYGYNSHWESNIYIGADTRKMYFRNSTWSGGSNEHGVTGAFHDWRTVLDSKSDVHSSGKLQITGNGTHYIQNGNVGIGTNDPQAKLAVNGVILAKEVKVKNDITVPDYVFEPDYNLPSLNEIESYVKENKHLPEIPSAADIKRDGLDLSQMNLLLLKKVEELTLHLIEKDKQIQNLHSQLAEQHEDIKTIKKQMQSQE